MILPWRWGVWHRALTMAGGNGKNIMWQLTCSVNTMMKKCLIITQGSVNASFTDSVRSHTVVPQCLLLLLVSYFTIQLWQRFAISSLTPAFPSMCWVATATSQWNIKKMRQLTAAWSGPTEASSQSVQIRVKVEGKPVANTGWTKNLSSLPQCTPSFTFHSHHKATNWKANLLTSSTSL